MKVPAPKHRLRRWKLAASAAFFFAVVLICGCPMARAQCDSLKSGERLWVRLLEPVSSYSSKAGSELEAMVIESPTCDGAEMVRPGTRVKGEIQAVRRVGMGIAHQTALLALGFNRLEAKEGEIAIGAKLLEIDNAREMVKNGVIHGVNPTNTPQGRITGRLTHLPEWDPYSHLALVAYRMAFPVFAEPEIYLPRGTDMKLELTKDVEVSKQIRSVAPKALPDDRDRTVLEITAGELPERTTTVRGREADIVNIALLGTREQLDVAFRAAGWTNSDPTTTKSVFHEMYAIMAFTNYAQAPISRQLVNGEGATETWQKGLDSYQKREHVRVWERNDVIEGQTLWLGAMTRETSAALSLRQRKFIHHIDADLDAGRGVVVRDLSLAGCVAAVYYVPRPEAERTAVNATGDPMRTDGSLAVVQLKDCENPVYERMPDGPTLAKRPHSKLARYVRMLVMNAKTDLVRGNVLYGTFDLTRMMIRARRNHTERAILARQNVEKPGARESAVVGDADSPVSSSFLNGN